MEITKVTKKVYKVLNVTRKPYLKFGLFKESRLKYNLSVQKTCFNCNKKFHDEDDTYLAMTNKGNKLLCEECAKIAIADILK